MRVDCNKTNELIVNLVIIINNKKVSKGWPCLLSEIFRLSADLL